MDFIKPILVPLFLLSTFISGIQAQDYYAPNEGSLIDLQKKKDIIFSISSFVGSKTENSLAGQLGYSPINKLGLQTSYSLLELTHGVNETSTINIANAAIGIYHFDEGNKNSENDVNQKNQGLLLGLYLGHAIGKATTTYKYDVNTEFSFSKTFLLGGLQVESKNVRFNIGLKAGFLDFKKIEINGNGDDIISEITQIISYDVYKFTEATFKLSLGPKAFNIYFSGTWMGTTYIEKVNFLNTVATIGMSFNIHHFNSKKQEKT